MKRQPIALPPGAVYVCAVCDNLVQADVYPAFLLWVTAFTRCNASPAEPHEEPWISCSHCSDRLRDNASTSVAGKRLP